MLAWDASAGKCRSLAQDLGVGSEVQVSGV